MKRLSLTKKVKTFSLTKKDFFPDQKINNVNGEKYFPDFS